MIFNIKKHKPILYNTLLSLSRNIFFYKDIKLIDNFETRIYLMFIHFSIMMIIFKKKKKHFNQDYYDQFFFNIENDLRELGFGDVSVNKKMKELNKVLYDILLKLDVEQKNIIKINKKLVFKYFPYLKGENSNKFNNFETYFIEFYKFCFDLSLDIMVKKAINFKY